MKPNQLLLLLFLSLSSLCAAQTHSLPVVSPENVWTVVERCPIYPGDKQALEKYLRKNLQYPNEAKRAGVEGKVQIGFIVCEDGSIYNPEVLRGIGHGCDEEALLLVREMPNWIPGKQEGTSVPVRYSLPIKFTLQP